MTRLLKPLNESCVMSMNLNTFKFPLDLVIPATFLYIFKVCFCKCEASKALKDSGISSRVGVGRGRPIVMTINPWKCTGFYYQMGA